MIPLKDGVLKIELDRDQALDLVAMLISLNTLSTAWFKKHEPTSTRSSELSREILKQIVEQDTFLVCELKDRTKHFHVSGLDLKV